MSTLPPLGGLRAFEAAARHLSVTLAAGELHVTPGAVSLQIKELEAALGVPLFVRRPRQLSLTPQGTDYFRSIRAAFRLIREATAGLTARSRRQVLTIGCTPGFAVQWLVPRLNRFEARHPELDLRISASNRVLGFGRDGVDITVRHGVGSYEGLASERLLDDDLLPVCSPVLAQGRAGLARIEDLRHCPLLHSEHRDDWRLWARAAGLADLDTEAGAVFVDGNGAIEAAKAGLGVALARLSLIGKEIADGSLVAPIPLGVASGLAYHLVYPAAALERPSVAAFRSWLLEEMAEAKVRAAG